MSKQTLYTAVGQFQQRQDNGNRYPVILINKKEYKADLQEMTLWTCLNWRILDLDQLREVYEQMIRDLIPSPTHTFEECVRRLVTRGLIMEGKGETGRDALYDLLGELFVIPVSSNPLLRLWAFLKLTFWNHMPFSRTRRLFERDRPNEEERRILRLARQAQLSTAELVKCVENGIYDVSTDDKILDALYDDEYTTSRNIPYLMRSAPSAGPVLEAVANLYLRQQVIFQML